MNNVTGLPITIDPNGPTHYATRCPVLVHPTQVKQNHKGEFPLVRALEQATGRVAEVTEDLEFLLIDKGAAQ